MNARIVGDHPAVALVSRQPRCLGGEGQIAGASPRSLDERDANRLRLRHARIDEHVECRIGLCIEPDGQRAFGHETELYHDLSYNSIVARQRVTPVHRPCARFVPNGQARPARGA